MHPALKDGLLEWRANSLYNQAEELRIPFREAEGSQAAGLGFGAREEDSACVREARHYGRGLAYISTHRWDNASLI